MPGVSEDQVRLAREVDLLSYLQASEPHELRRSGPNEYRTASHGSLVISNGLWIWNRGNVGGRSALDYLMKIRGMGFVEAVETVLGSRAAPVSVLPVEKAPKQPPPKKERKAFSLPQRTRFAAHALSYLQRRGVSAKVIQRCLHDGSVYESRDKGKTVCVFVGYDGKRVPRFAHMRGIYEKYHRDADGSDKQYSFSIPAKNLSSKHLAVFEAPIDAMSHATLQQRGFWGPIKSRDFMGEGGTTEQSGFPAQGGSSGAQSVTTREWDGHRLSLGGTSSVALISFLERNPQITRVILHLDNDAAGITAARKIKAELNADSRFKHIRVSVNPPHRENDYNDVLLRDIRLEHEQKQPGHRKDTGYILS